MIFSFFVQMICKLATVVGRDVTVRLLLTRFAELCSDALLHVRKVKLVF